MKQIYKIRDVTARLRRDLRMVFIPSASGEEMPNRDRALLYFELYRFYFKGDEFDVIDELWRELETDFYEAEVVFGRPVNRAFQMLKQHCDRVATTGTLLERCAKSDQNTTKVLSRQIEECLIEEFKYINDEKLESQINQLVEISVESSGLRRHLGQKEGRNSLLRSYARKKKLQNLFLPRVAELKSRNGSKPPTNQT